MNEKPIIILAIIFGSLTIVLSLINPIFDVDMPWAIVTAPSALYFAVFLMPYAIRQEKNKKDKK